MGVTGGARPINRGGGLPGLFGAAPAAEDAAGAAAGSPSTGLRAGRPAPNPPAGAVRQRWNSAAGKWEYMDENGKLI